MSYPVFGNLSLGNVSGNIKLFVNHSGIGNLTGIGYNNNAITFGVNQSATDTPEMTINRIGDVNILGNVLTGGNVVVNSIVPSTSTTTGALRIAGGAGIQGDIFLGGNLTTSRDIDCIGNLQIDSTTPSISTTTGALVVAGGVGIRGNIFLGGNLTLSRDIDCNGNIQIDAITPSISTTTGALVVAGGAGIVGNVYTGGNVIINAIAPSTSTTTGALIVSGGAGIGGSLNAGADAFINSVRVGRGRNSNLSNTVVGFNVAQAINTAYNCTAIGYEALNSNSDQPNSTALGYRAGYTGGGGYENTFLGAQTLCSVNGYSMSTALGFGATITASNQVVLGRSTESVFIPGTTGSTSTTTGALRIAGGVGIQGNLNIGGLTYHVYDTSFNGNAQILSQTASTSTTSGALVVAGGAGIQGNLNIGLDSFFNGNIQLTQLNNPLTIVSRNASTINSTLASGSDVGIFYGATNPAAAGLVISPRGTGGGIKMAANGNIGIGTSNPQMILDVSGGIGTKIHNLFTNSQNGVMTLGSYRVYTSGLFDVGFALYHDQVGATVLNAASGQQIDFKINNVLRMRLNQDGNFGIGTTNPQAKLDVNGNINITASNTSYISGPLVSTNTTSSTSTTTGALVVSGGAGIGGNVFLGGNLTTSRDIECNGNIQIANVANFLSDASFNGNVLFSNDNIINTPDISNVTEYTTTITRQSLGTTNMRWLAMSSTGQHIAVINIATTPFTVFVSNDFGVTFSNRAGVGYTTASGSVAVSPTGRNMVAMAYAVGTSQAYIYSTNFGVNWATSPTLTTGSFTPTTTQPSLYVNDNGIIYFSNTTFAYSLPSLGSTTATTLSNNSNGQSISASYDGRYILSTHSSAAAYVSSNNGTSFSSTGQNGINGAVSGNGQYMLLLNGTNIVVSNNFGASGSWTTISAITVPNSAIYFTTSYNGQEIIVASNTNSSIYYSTNYGASWATLSTSLTNILNVVLSGDGSRYAISYAAGSNNVGISTATLINTTTRVKQKQITGFMDVSCGLIQPSFILGNPIAPTDDMYGSFIQLTGSANLFQVLPTPVISSRRSAEITIWNNSSVTQTILTPQGLIFGFAPAGSGLIDVLIQDRLKLRSDGYNWVNMASAYPPRLSYSVPPVLSPYDIGFMYLATQGSITSATLNSNQQLATITGVLTGFYMANVLHSITITATAITISAGFGSSTGTNNYREDSFTTTATVSTFPFALNSVISVSGTQTIYFNYRHNNSGASTSTNGNRTIFTLTRIG